jgi:hypothetical protein
LNAKRTQGPLKFIHPDDPDSLWQIAPRDGWGMLRPSEQDLVDEQFHVALVNACDAGLLDLAEKGLEAMDAYLALHNGTQMANGNYPHLLTCSADHRQPIGCGCCSCPIGRERKRLAAVEAERDRLRGLLTYVYGVTGVIDNGHCVFCRRARLWTAAGANNPPLPCENPDCVTHEIDAKLAASPNQKAKVHGE